MEERRPLRRQTDDHLSACSNELASSTQLRSMKVIMLTLSLLFFASIPVRSEEAIPIRQSTTIQGGKGLGTRVYTPLEDEAPFCKKVTEKQIDLWADVTMPKPSSSSEEEWKKMEKENIEREKTLISVEDYELKQRIGEYVGWFGIVRKTEYDATKDQTNLLIEHKYFDGATDLDLQVVSIYGAGDFHVVIPGQVRESLVPPLSLICAYGKVSKGRDDVPTLTAEYIRVWDWGLFTFMDYGKDKSNSNWTKLRKVAGGEAYSSQPTLDFYEERLGKR